MAKVRIKKRHKENKATTYIGIDPGMSGGIATIQGSKIEVYPMPHTELDIWRMFRDLPNRESSIATIEFIQPAIHAIGKLQMSKLYGNYASLRMLLTVLEIPFDDVKAVDWQKAMKTGNKKKGESSPKWKDRLRAKAQRLFPKLPAWNWNKGEQRKISDALLIAEYCRRKHEGTLG